MVKIITTLGPATRSEEALRKIKARGVDYVRVNMSHSSLKDLAYFIILAKKIGLPFMLDTEGSQIRTGWLPAKSLELKENKVIRIYDPTTKSAISPEGLPIRPAGILKQLQQGDLMHIDFNALVLKIIDISTVKQGYVMAQTLTAGLAGSNKAVAITPYLDRRINLPPLSEKDYRAIELGLKHNIKHIAVSFVRKPEDIETVRKASKNTMAIISKIECVDAIHNLDGIIAKTDCLLIDRGDLSKEISIDKIPFAQKYILNKAAKSNKPVFVATNLLETMVTKPLPTRAEVNDIASTIRDGAAGLALAAETAIGKHPMESINVLRKIIAQSEMPRIDSRHLTNAEPLALVPPHGGKLIDRVLKESPDHKYLKNLPKIHIDEATQMDVEQIAIGTFSPLEGFMGKKDLKNVLNNMRLANGTIWTLPIILTINQEQARKLKTGHDIALTDKRGRALAIMHLAEKYKFDKEELTKKLYGTTDQTHPGVKMINQMGPVFLGGKIDLVRRRSSEMGQYELAPRQIRKLFEERGWWKVVGFHTRNVIHRGHEFIQLDAMKRGGCDGLFVNPIVGRKKLGDYQAKYIAQTYQAMIDKFYPPDKVIFSVFSTYSRYAGPREAIFTAICRKNFGCSHFIVGRDHTGVGSFYGPTASHDIFDKFPDLGIEAIKYNKVFYSKKLKRHVHEDGNKKFGEKDRLDISGTQARKIFTSGKKPPSWFMRPQISEIIAKAIKNGDKVFVEKA